MALLTTLYHSSSSLVAGTVTNDSGEYAYESVEGDPLQTRIYTLKNGLKVYLSAYDREPRIQTYIAVRAGAKHDPAENTGLAHYLEHMMFKGTKNYGTHNWEEEQKLLKEISDLYEKHAAEKDAEKKKEIYKQIDQKSNEAANFTIPNEYDKMMSSLGAKGTNAFTSSEQTVYVNDVPANELEKWAKLESERFSQLVLRLFHTELETVYEEFNMGQDSDTRKMFASLMEAMYPTHQYGTQTVIGTGEHLKNPSMEAIHKYFDTYYVANNLAICLSGDLDYDKTIRLLDKYFGDLQPGEIPEFKFSPEEPLTEPVVKEVVGPQEEFIYLGFRLGGSDTKDAVLLKMINSIMQNGRAGLMDLNLLQKQKVLSAGAFDYIRKDYSSHIFYANAREGQSLEECKALLLEQIQNLKDGEFDNELLQSVIKNMKLEKMKAFERNRTRAMAMVEAFILDKDWADVVNEVDELGKITKEDIVAFANKNYLENYVVCYKRTGEDKNVYKVEKPELTPIDLNRTEESVFYKDFANVESTSLEPLFLDYERDIQTMPVKGPVELNYLKNQINKTFALYYVFDMGTNNDRRLGVAIDYLPYLGTDKYTAEDLQKEFYRLGLKFNVSSSANQIYVSLSGLEESLEEGIKLFEHILANVQPDKAALENMIADVMKSRENAKLDKRTIFWRALFNYAKYGGKSEYTNLLSEAELKELTGQQLVDLVKGLRDYEHRVLYYGAKDPKSVNLLLAKYHEMPETYKKLPAAKQFEELDTDKDRVLFMDYDMVQAQVLMVSKDQDFTVDLLPDAKLFGEYFGAGLSSIVFQEIREAKALAYSAFASYSTPRKKEDSHYSFAFIGTQADKIKEAMPAMRQLMNEMPMAETQFNGARDAVMKKIESERITQTDIFFNQIAAEKQGLDYDVRKNVYEGVAKADLESLKGFFDKHIKDRNYTIVVMGSKDELDMDYVKSLGDFQELQLEEVFGY